MVPHGSRSVATMLGVGYDGSLVEPCRSVGGGVGRQAQESHRDWTRPPSPPTPPHFPPKSPFFPIFYKLYPRQILDRCLKMWYNSSMETKKHTSFRVSIKILSLLTVLAKELNQSRVAVLEIAVRDLAIKHKVGQK